MTHRSGDDTNRSRPVRWPSRPDDVGQRGAESVDLGCPASRATDEAAEGFQCEAVLSTSHGLFRVDQSEQ